MKLRWLFVATIGVACGVEALDLTGKQCPCVDGYVCDTSTNTCVTTLTTPPPIDAGNDIDARDAAVPDASGAITVLDLLPKWRTGNGIRWEWKAIGDPTKFARYELVTGKSAADVRARASTTRTFTPTTNPELGEFGGRAPDAGPPVSLWTISDGHAENETVVAQVVAYDTNGNTSVSDIANSTTTRPLRELVVYAEGRPDGGVFVPSTGTRIVQDNPYDGGSCIEHTVTCQGVPPCGVEAGMASIDGLEAVGIEATEFETAFLELAVRGTKLPGKYVDVILFVGLDNCGAQCRLRFSGLSFGTKPGEWRLLQIPLGRFKGNDGSGNALTANQLGNRKRIAAFLVDAEQPDAGKIGLDQVRIRW